MGASLGAARFAAACVLSCGLLVSSSSAGQTAHFAPDTARTLEQGRLETGVFQRARYGLTDQTELALHPLLALAAPHMGVKVRWTDGATVALATRHTVDWPTPLLSLTAREGSGGLLPPDVEVPQVLGTSHHLLASLEAAAQVLVTARVGLHFGTTFGSGRLHDLELPLLFARTAHYTHGPTLEAGLDLDLRVVGPLMLNADLDLFVAGHPAAGCRVPAIGHKPLAAVTSWL